MRARPGKGGFRSRYGRIQAGRRTQWQPVKLNDAFCPGDSIRVQAKSRADITLLNQSVLRLNSNSTITVPAPKEQTTGVVDLLGGRPTS